MLVYTKPVVKDEHGVCWVNLSLTSLKACFVWQCVITPKHKQRLHCDRGANIFYPFKCQINLKFLNWGRNKTMWCQNKEMGSRYTWLADVGGSIFCAMKEGGGCRPEYACVRCAHALEKLCVFIFMQVKLTFALLSLCLLNLALQEHNFFY